MADQRLTQDWLSLEKYRLEVIEDWPDGPKKEAARKAVLSQIGSLRRPPDGPIEGSFSIVLPGPLPPRRPVHD